jgi:hypothetical protein
LVPEAASEEQVNVTPTQAESVVPETPAAAVDEPEKQSSASTESPAEEDASPSAVSPDSVVVEEEAASPKQPEECSLNKEAAESPALPEMSSQVTVAN